MSKHCDKEACQHLSLKVASLIMYLSTPWYVSIYLYIQCTSTFSPTFFDTSRPILPKVWLAFVDKNVAGVE